LVYIIYMNDIIYLIEMKKKRNMDAAAYSPEHLRHKFEEENELMDKILKMINDAKRAL